MNLSSIIEEYIHDLLIDTDYIEVKRNDLANQFSCVPSQINYVISTRFIPELGFYVESKRGGGGFIKISKFDLTNEKYLMHIISEMDNKLSQNVADIYLNNLLVYNVLDEKTARLIKIAISDKSLENVDKLDRDKVRSDIFKCLLINVI
ncbi:MAG: transcriptional repressor, CtsR [Clostridia bacterium]|jgi:transcriptional regulator CtsR|nr:transcriptional repressor, CtsR [Clostridia bacterium]